MKKIAAALLAALMLVALTACNGGGDKIIDVSDPVATEAPVATDEGEGLGLTRDYGTLMGMVAAGYIHSAGVRTDGTVLTAGHDYYGQRKTSDWTDVKYIAAGKSVTVGVKNDGTVLVAGSLASGDITTAAGWTNVFMADAGGDHIAAVLNDGTVVATGDNASGQCDVSSWSNIVAVACGDAFTVGLTAAGTVVATAGAPDISALGQVKAIAAGGASGVVGITAEGGLVGTVDVSAFAGRTDIVSAGVDDCGAACVFADGTMLASLAAGVAPDPDYSAGTVDLTTVTNAVSVSVGTNHVVALLADGTAAAYGVNDDLQCDVGRFNLRPYIETNDNGTFIRGLQYGMTLADAKPYVAAIAGSEDITYVVKGFDDTGAETETAKTEADPVATGILARAGETDIGTIVLLGDIDGDGAVTETDKTTAETYITGETPLSGAYRRAAQLEYTAMGKLACDEASVAILEAAAAGTGTIEQFSARKTDIYKEKYDEMYAENKDTVGWITIARTNIDYPVMFDASGEWYYNTHTPEKAKADSGSIYSYYFYSDDLKNMVVTGHNSRPSGSMFHQLHHIQEFNLGNSNCAQTKYCGVELTGLPDLKIYSNRVWTISIFGRESQWEMFSMYETKAGCNIVDTLYDNVWWRWGDNARLKTTDDEIKTWIDKQISLTEIPFDTTVTVDDDFMTVFTCGNEHADATDGARLYFFFKKVD